MIDIQRVTETERKDRGTGCEKVGRKEGEKNSDGVRVTGNNRLRPGKKRLSHWQNASISLKGEKKILSKNNTSKKVWTRAPRTELYRLT